MATENQIQQLWQDILILEERIDYCCRDIVFWDFRVRIRDKYGNIMSDYLENRKTGIMRRGKNFTMEVPIDPIPKYETDGLGGSLSAVEFVDGDLYKCILNTYVTNGTSPIVDLCSILYRGVEGAYYEQSARKTTTRLGFVPVSGFLTVHPMDADGNEGTINLAYNSHGNSMQKFVVLNTHFARLTNGKLYVDVYKPLDGDLGFTNTTYKKPYGLIYYMDVRDVTRGA